MPAQGTKRSKSTTREMGKCYKKGISTFVTGRALLGIKPIGRDAKHVVALDANAVENGAYDGSRSARDARGGRTRDAACLRQALRGHELILACRAARLKTDDGILTMCSAHLLDMETAGMDGRLGMRQSRGLWPALRDKLWVARRAPDIAKGRASVAKMMYFGPCQTWDQQATEK